MLPTWPISLRLRHAVSACARIEVLMPGAKSRPMKLRGGLDSSAGEFVVAEARTRAAVQVAFMFVHSPDGDRGEPRGLRENQLQRRPLFHSLCHHSNCVERFAIDSDPTIASEATLRPRVAFPVHTASRQRLALRPPQPARQGRPPNQESSCAYEERNVGQCLAARGVPHRHR